MIGLIGGTLGAIGGGILGWNQAEAHNSDLRKQNREAQQSLTENQRRLRLVENDQREALYARQVDQIGEIQNIAGTSRGMARVILNARARANRDASALAEQFAQQQENLQIQKGNIARQLGNQMQSPLMGAIQGGMTFGSLGATLGNAADGLLTAMQNQKAMPHAPTTDATPEQQMEFMAKLDAIRAGIDAKDLNANTIAPFLKQRQNQMLQFDQQQRMGTLQIELLEMQKSHQQWQYNQARSLFGFGG